MKQETNCDGLMIGRGADGNPWLFSQLKAALSGETIPEAPSLAERLEQVREHLHMLIDFKGEVIAVKEMRRHVCTYLKGMPKAAEYRSRFHQMNTETEFLELLKIYEAAVDEYNRTENLKYAVISSKK